MCVCVCVDGQPDRRQADRFISIVYCTLSEILTTKQNYEIHFKAAYSVTLIFFLFKSFVKIELSYVFTINMFSAAENCM